MAYHEVESGKLEDFTLKKYSAKVPDKEELEKLTKVMEQKSIEIHDLIIGITEHLASHRNRMDAIANQLTNYAGVSLQQQIDKLAERTEINECEITATRGKRDEADNALSKRIDDIYIKLGILYEHTQCLNPVAPDTHPVSENQTERLNPTKRKSRLPKIDSIIAIDDLVFKVVGIIFEDGIAEYNLVLERGYNFYFTNLSNIPSGWSVIYPPYQLIFTPDSHIPFIPSLRMTLQDRKIVTQLPKPPQPHYPQVGEFVWWLPQYGSNTVYAKVTKVYAETNPHVDLEQCKNGTVTYVPYGETEGCWSFPE